MADQITILLCTDFSNVTGRLLDEAVAYAKAFGGRVVVLHVAAEQPEFVGFEPGPQTVRDNVAHEHRDEHRHVQELADAVTAKGVEAEALLVQGGVADKVLEQAHRLQARAILMGSHGHGALFDLLVGSATASVLKKTDMPVLVVPAPRPTSDLISK